MIIKVLGSGCSKCKKLEANVHKALAENGITATVIKVSDLKDIMAFGVMMTPALVIDDKVITSGKVLTVQDIKAILSKEV